MNENQQSGGWRTWFWNFMFLLFVVGLLVAIAIPNFVGSHPSKTSGIINNLRQIDGAKNEWAVEHGFTNVSQIEELTNQPTQHDLAPYLHFQTNRDGSFQSMAGEVYAINPLNKSPEARLGRKIYSYPKGSIIRFTDNTNYLFPFELVLPDGTTLHNNF
jgi:hypothetical protein